MGYLFNNGPLNLWETFITQDNVICLNEGQKLSIICYIRVAVAATIDLGDKGKRSIRHYSDKKLYKICCCCGSDGASVLISVQSIINVQSG